MLDKALKLLSKASTVMAIIQVVVEIVDYAREKVQGLKGKEKEEDA